MGTSDTAAIHRRARLGVIAAALVVGFPPSTIAQPLLGQSPLCEASAALILPCPGTRDTCLVVGDNEVSDKLFWFPIRNATKSPFSFGGSHLGHWAATR
ncbi:hypothetical protein [uncultured Thiodictyon sp.]|uniref:hypothetical protein n=1 Tax=uncultured Thiodictyon sp. TaxID=1846217 RepID=UPI0025F16AB9|nr:hypothetical protein [uncultured Thiodictyon sp.]